MPIDDVGPILRALDAAPPHALLAVLSDGLRAGFGASDVQLWLVDYEGTTLRGLGVADGQQAATVPVDAAGQGAALREHHVVAVPATGGRTTLYAPVSIRSERLGVLELTVEDASARQRARLETIGTAVGYVLLAGRRYTDQFEAVRRSVDMALPAEMQWELLPVLAHDGPDFSLAGRLEPAYDIGGDNFDYAVDAEGVTVSVTDAMGHGTRAALMSGLAVSALRNARRRGLGLRQQARAANTALHDQFEGYVTGCLLRVSRGDGAAEVVNAGHPAPLVLRGGDVHRWEPEADLPLGMFGDTDFRAQPARVEPGDRVLVFSDGIVEAAPEDGEEFGLHRVAAHLEATTDLPLVEVVRRLTIAVMEHRAGQLDDDATVVCLDYRRY